MSRRRVEVPVQPLAYRRAEAAAALGMSVELFDEHVRPFVPAARVGSIVTYPVAGLTRWLEAHSSSPADDLRTVV